MNATISREYGLGDQVLIRYSHNLIIIEELIKTGGEAEDSTRSTVNRHATRENTVGQTVMTMPIEDQTATMKVTVDRGTMSPKIEEFNLNKITVDQTTMQDKTIMTEGTMEDGRETITLVVVAGMANPMSVFTVTNQAIESRIVRCGADIKMI